MPTILSHPAVPLALGAGLGARAIPPRLLAAGVVACVLPDADVIGHALGVPWGSDFAHRGFTHSLPFALGLALLGAAAWRRLGAPPLTVLSFLFAAGASHGLLDACTNGGSGIALLWPLSSERYFAPFRVIEVSPIGVVRFLSARGLDVLASELVWVWLPAALLAALLAAARRLRANRREPLDPHAGGV